jgi:hypothetical protein
VCASRADAPQVVPQPDKREYDPHAPHLAAAAAERDVYVPAHNVTYFHVDQRSNVYRRIHLFSVACHCRQKPANV